MQLYSKTSFLYGHQFLENLVTTLLLSKNLAVMAYLLIQIQILVPMRYNGDTYTCSYIEVL